MKSNIAKTELICPGCNRAIQVEYNSRSRRLVRDTMCEHCGTMIQYITNKTKYQKALKEIDEYGKDIDALYEYAELANNKIKTYITTELEKNRTPRDILQEARLLSETKREMAQKPDAVLHKETQCKDTKDLFVQDNKTNAYIAQKLQEQKNDDSRKHREQIDKAQILILISCVTVIPLFLGILGLASDSICWISTLVFCCTAGILELVKK